MLSKYNFVPSSGMQNTTPIVFDIGDTNVTAGLIITELTFEYTKSSNRRPKQEQPGSWMGFTKTEEILVHTSFDIVDATTTAMNAKKRLLRSSVEFNNPATIIPLVPILGTLVLRFDGDTEDIQAPVSLDGDISMPYSVGNPMYVAAQVTWVAPDGFFTGVTSGSYYYPQ